MLIATTEGLTRATTSAIDGNADASLSTAGGVQLGSMGVMVEVSDESGGDEVSAGDSRQLLPTKRHTMIRAVSRYFRFILFIIFIIMASLYS